MSVQNLMSADISRDVVDAIYQVHHEMGPGLLESAYESCLELELVDRGYFIERQKYLPLLYKRRKVDADTD